MIIVRKSEDRRHMGGTDQKTWMTFDWENEADPLRNGFGLLKVLNEEILSPGSGFILHTHQAMVIVTYVREGMVVYKGPLENPDLLGTQEFHLDNVLPGAKQYAFDLSPTEDVHIFQSGFTALGGPLGPSGIKKLYTQAERKGILKLIASPDGREASLSLQQDVQIYSTFIHQGNHMIHEMKPGRSAWLHVVKGDIKLDGIPLRTGDGAGLSAERSVSFTAKGPTEILLFDLGGEVPGEAKPDAPAKRETVKIG